jgi:tRNA(Arg) A34 adenosine deaminase TadA
MNLHMQCEFVLPHWLESFVKAWPGSLSTVEQRMQLAVALSVENVRHKTGGPFGALVIDERSKRLLSVGVNLVTALDLSIAHAEMVALSLAQSAISDWNLSAQTEVQLVTSCEPCAMCFGAVPWSGVTSLAWGARKEDAEAAGFDEGDKLANWVQALENRGIRTQGDVLRKEAAAVLARYAHKEGTIYHPNSN